MFEQGLALTAIGMAFVFLFLALLILAMNVLARTVRALEARYPEKMEGAGLEKEDDSEIALAIAVTGTFTHKI